MHVVTPTSEVGVMLAKFTGLILAFRDETAKTAKIMHEPLLSPVRNLIVQKF